MKVPKIKFSRKSVEWEPRLYMLSYGQTDGPRTDGWTDGHNDDNRRICKYEMRLKITCNTEKPEISCPQKGYIPTSSPDSTVGIATRYGLDGPGIESRWGRDFPHLFGPFLRPTQFPVK
jgi:hypothetical protein